MLTYRSGDLKVKDTESINDASLVYEKKSHIPIPIILIQLVLSS